MTPSAPSRGLPARQSHAPVLSVSELTARIKGVLEADFDEVWVAGEISGLRSPPSGHRYFTLKDRTSQLRCVMFRGQAGLLRFRPEDGLEVIIRGRIGLYPARGDMQLYASGMEPRGVGAQQLALEQLKAALAAEGLFAAERKKPLPFFPRRVGVVTAQTGAAIHDILTIVYQRCAYTHVLLRPAKVQGAGAEAEIAAGIRELNEHAEAEVIIVGRGGGSREDLSVFNDEVVARAIAASEIPVVAAVGHEIDLSIADLVADRRAPTPTAAAEMVMPRWDDLQARIGTQARALVMAMQRHMSRRRQAVLSLRQRLRDPHHDLGVRRNQLHALAAHLRGAFQRRGERAQARLQELSATLNSLSPLAVLGRGYSLTRTIPDGRVVANAGQLRPGGRVRLMFAAGEAIARIEQIQEGEEQGETAAENV